MTNFFLIAAQIVLAPILFCLFFFGTMFRVVGDVVVIVGAKIAVFCMTKKQIEAAAKNNDNPHI